MVNATLGIAPTAPTTLPFISDWLGVVSVGLTLIGFILTILSVQKSKIAADQAKEAANHVNTAFLKYNTVADLSSAIAKLDEVKRLHRLCGWEILAERYSDARKIITSINQPSYNLTEDQQSRLQNAAMQLNKMENAVEKAVYDGNKDNTMLLKHSKILSTVIDDVLAIIVAIKNI